MFKVLDVPKNKSLREKGKKPDKILFYWTKDMFWGKERTMVITYNPRTAKKKKYIFDEKWPLSEIPFLSIKGNSMLGRKVGLSPKR